MKHDGYKHSLEARARTIKVMMGPVKPLSSDMVGSIPTSPPRCLCSPMVRAAGLYPVH